MEKAKNKETIKRFIKRTNLVFLLITFVSAIIIITLIYLPFYSALKKSLITDFNQVALTKYNYIEYTLDRGLGGARSISSRTKIKETIYEYYDNDITLEELKIEIQPKYEEGVLAFENLILANRYLNNHIIVANYINDEDNLLPSNILIFENYNEMQLKVYIEENNGSVLFSIFSPIIEQNILIAYDILVFDLTNSIFSLSNDNLKVALINTDDFDELLSNSKNISVKNGFISFSKNKQYYFTSKLTDDVYFSMSQKESILFGVVNDLSYKTLIVSILLLIIFSIVIYFNTVVFANKRLLNLETKNIGLTAEVLESNLDPLTKVGSRKYGTTKLEEAFVSYKSGNNNMLVLMFDIDSLKFYNDNYGHFLGDAVIKEVVASVNSVIKPIDEVFRWGGDEFIAIIKNVTKEEAKRFAKEVLDKVREIALYCEGTKFEPTISIGISFFKEEDKEYSEVLRRADQAMYKSKVQGKNACSVVI